MEKSQKKSENTKVLKDIKAVSFDFDDTLVNEKFWIKSKWEKTFDEYAFLSPDIKNTFFKIYQQRGPLYKFHVNDTLEALKIDKKFVKKIVSRFISIKEGEMLMEGAKDVLKILKSRGIKVGIITDGKKSRQEPRIKNAGIYDLVECIFYGNGKNEKKPAKGFDEKILKKFKIQSKEQFLYVGNDFLNDIEGMAEQGFRACWVTEEKMGKAGKKIIKIKNLKELLN